MTNPLIEILVDRFLACPLPESVCADPCATQRGYPHRFGTNLLTADEAREVLRFVCGDLLAEHGCDPVGANTHEESENCWCRPTVETFENGNRLIVHNDPN